MSARLIHCDCLHSNEHMTDIIGKVKENKPKQWWIETGRYMKKGLPLCLQTELLLELQAEFQKKAPQI